MLTFRVSHRVDEMGAMAVAKAAIWQRDPADRIGMASQESIRGAQGPRPLASLVRAPARRLNAAVQPCLCIRKRPQGRCHPTQLVPLRANWVGACATGASRSLSPQLDRARKIYQIDFVRHRYLPFLLSEL